MKLKVLDLFSGVGGMSLGLESTGAFETVAFCEIDVHKHRILADHWPKVPIYDDVRTLTADALRRDGIAIDGMCGGFPCQDVSIANVTGAGLDGSRSGLWFEYARLIGELRPCFVIVENVAELLARGMGRVLGSLAELGYDAEWRPLRGCDVGLPFLGERIWIVATPSRPRRKGCFQYLRSLGIEAASPAERRDQAIRARHRLETDLRSLRADDGLSVAMERRRLHGLGNAVTPEVPRRIGKAILEAEGLTR